MTVTADWSRIWKRSLSVNLGDQAAIAGRREACDRCRQKDRMGSTRSLSKGTRQGQEGCDQKRNIFWSMDIMSFCMERVG